MSWIKLITNIWSGRYFQHYIRLIMMLKVYQSTKSMKANWSLMALFFPTLIDQIGKIDKQNELAINVFGYDDDVHPLHVINNYDKNPIILILIMEGENKHYCCIKDFNKLCYNQNKHKRKKHFCVRCITCHTSEKTLKEHMIYCESVDARPTRCVYPTVKEDGTPPSTQFEKYQNLLKCPCAIYADTECIIKSIPAYAEEGQKTVKKQYTRGLFVCI